MKSTETSLVVHVQLRAFLDLNKTPHRSKSVTKTCSAPTDGDGFWALSLEAGQKFWAKARLKLRSTHSRRRGKQVQVFQHWAWSASCTSGGVKVIKQTFKHLSFPFDTHAFIMTKARHTSYCAFFVRF